jgi:hypothetical protein
MAYSRHDHDDDHIRKQRKYNHQPLGVLMSNTTITPNMGLVVPVVGVDPGPDWANNLNASLTTIDGHNHVPGSGVQITPNGLNINVDLPFNNNNATLLRSTRYSPQSANLNGVSDLGCLYVVSADLWYNDGSGNQIRFTQSGSIVGATGTITGLPSGTASASYAAGTFVFQSATNTAANIDGASYILRNSTASSNGLTLAPPNAMASSYGLVLPTIPAETALLSIDTSGNITSGQITNGLNVITSNTNNSSGGLSIVRGTINTATATEVTGEGFSFSVTGTGAATVTFTTAFAGLPVVVASPVSFANGIVSIGSIGFSSFTFLQQNYVTQGSVDGEISFIAIGIRA